MAFPTSGLSNNQVHKEGNRTFVYDSALGVWDQVRETDRTENKIFSGNLTGVSGEFPVRSIGGIRQALVLLWHVSLRATGMLLPLIPY